MSSSQSPQEAVDASQLPSLQPQQPLNDDETANNDANIDEEDNNDDNNDDNAADDPPFIDLRQHSTAPQISEMDDDYVSDLVRRINPLNAPSTNSFISFKRGKGKLALPVSVCQSIVNNANLSEREKQVAIMQAIVDYRFLSKPEQQAQKAINQGLTASVKAGIRTKIKQLFPASAAEAAAASSGRRRRSVAPEQQEEEEEEMMGGAPGMRGRASNEQDRGSLINDLQSSSSDSSRRKVCTFAASVRGQADNVSNDGVDLALQTVAKASDRMFYPHLKNDDPKRLLFTVEVNEVNDIPAAGGTTAAKDIRREKTLINIVASSEQAFQYGMIKVMEALGADAERREQYVVTKLTRNAQTNKVIDSVEEFNRERRANRQGPAVNNVAQADITAGE